MIASFVLGNAAVLSNASFATGVGPLSPIQPPSNAVDVSLARRTFNGTCLSLGSSCPRTEAPRTSEITSLARPACANGAAQALSVVVPGATAAFWW